MTEKCRIRTPNEINADLDEAEEDLASAMERVEELEDEISDLKRELKLSCDHYREGPEGLDVEALRERELKLSCDHYREGPEGLDVEALRERELLEALRERELLRFEETQGREYVGPVQLVRTDLQLPAPTPDVEPGSVAALCFDTFPWLYEARGVAHA